MTDEQFWQELVSIMLKAVCLIERAKLKREHTTADLRKAGKQAICKEGAE